MTSADLPDVPRSGRSGCDAPVTVTAAALAVAGAVLLLALPACQGDTSPLPPVHPNWNMDQQARFDPQEPSDFFPDGRAMRPQVEGTVAVGHLQEDDHLYRGVVEGEFAMDLPAADADGLPFTLDRPFLERGQERYNIYCVPCHDDTGSGKGIIVERGMMPPPSFYEDRILAMPIGQLYDIVTHGARNMSAYRNQVALRDRWAIASYVRALQLSRNVGIDQIPADKAGAERWETR